MKLRKTTFILAFAIVSACITAQTETDTIPAPVATDPATMTTTEESTAPPATDVAEPTGTVVSTEDGVDPGNIESVPTSKASVADAPNLRKANIFFRKKAYSEAIPYYEKALITDSENKLILSNLGECYRMTNDMQGQMRMYSSLVNKGQADPIHELYYGQALMEAGELEQAKPYLEKYTADERGKKLASSAEKKNIYTKNADAYNVNFAEFNSLENDFCAVKFQEHLVFASTRSQTEWIKREQGWTNGNFLNLYSVKKNAAGVMEPPTLFMTDLKSKFNDGPIAFSQDFNTVFFTRNNSRKSERAKDGTYKLKILEATLDQNGFSMVKPMPFTSKDYNFAHPSISPDGYTLYFASDMEGGKGGMDLYLSRKDSGGVWGTPENLGDAINTAGNEVFPFIAINGALYFSSDGHDGLGGLDIYEAKMKDGKAVKIYNMGEPVNSLRDDFGYYLTEDNKTGYLSSNRRLGGLDDDVYTLEVMREVKRGKEVTIVTKDKETGLPLPDTKIILNGDTLKTNEKGEYALSAEEEIEYKIEATKEDYFKAEDKFTSNIVPEDEFTRELILEKDPKLFLRALITDSKSNELLEGVTIKIIDIETNSEVDNYVTTASGDYFKFMWGKRIGDRLAYLIKLDKPGYLQRSVVFTHTIDKPGEINLNEKLSLTLGKVEVGMDLAKMIDIKPIYFDFGKSTIRNDAAMELDKIVQVMNEYPNMFIELGSHTDCRSSAASNMKLSSARAKSSVAYIVKRGINKMRITAKGYGESKLLNNCACEGKVQSNCPEEEHEKNRRTEFLITKLK